MSLPCKFQEAQYQPIYKIWLDKIAAIEETLDYKDLLGKVICALGGPEDSKQSEEADVTAPQLVIDLSNDET